MIQAAGLWSSGRVMLVADHNPGCANSAASPPSSVAESVAAEGGRRVAEPGNRRLVLIATLTGQFATAFPVTLFSVVLAPIARSYGVAESLLTWAITGPFLVMAVCTPVFGKLGDTYGHRRLFLIGLAGSTVAALATTPWIARHLSIPDGVSRVILPGLCVGE